MWRAFVELLSQLAPLYQGLHDAAMKLPMVRRFTGNLDLIKSVRRPLVKQYNFMNGQIATKLLVLVQPMGVLRCRKARKFMWSGGSTCQSFKVNPKQLRKWGAA